MPEKFITNPHERDIEAEGVYLEDEENVYVKKRKKLVMGATFIINDADMSLDKLKNCNPRRF